MYRQRSSKQQAAAGAAAGGGVKKFVPPNLMPWTYSQLLGTVWVRSASTFYSTG